MATYWISRGDRSGESTLKFSRAIEDYLKAIYLLSEEEASEPTNATLAARLQVSGASVTNMLRRLHELGLVEHELYQAAQLTPRGRVIALEVVRHHRLVEMFLVDALGMEWDEIHAEAEVLEHHISPRLEALIDARLGHPKFDPHGAPIPGPGGVMPEFQYRSLADLDAGEEGIVQRVSDESPEVLRYLARIGMTLGSRIRVTLRGPFNGPLSIAMPDGNEHALGIELARQIEVAA